jgi:hypothetical protein
MFFYMKPSLIWDVMQRRLFTDVSGRPTGPIFKGQAVQDEIDLFHYF